MTGTTELTAGLTVRWEGATAEHRQALAEALEVGPGATTAGGPPGTDLTFGPARAAPRRPPDHVRAGVRCWTGVGPGGAAVDVGLGDATARLGPGRVDVGADGPLPRLRLGLRRLLPTVVAHLVTPEAVIVHGATVGTAAGHLVVVGDSGAGKSSLAHAAIAAGWEVGGDDLCVVRPGPRGPTVSGVRRPLAVPAALAGRDLRARPVGDARDRVELPALLLVRGTRPVVGVVVLAHGGVDAALAAVAGHTVLTEVLGATVPRPAEPAPRAALAATAALCRVGAWRLAHDVRTPAGARASLEVLETALGRGRDHP